MKTSLISLNIIFALCISFSCLYPFRNAFTNPNRCAVIQQVQNGQVIVAQRQVQFQNDTFLGTNGYYTHGQNLVNQKQASMNDDIVNTLKEQNQILRDLVNKLGGQTPTTPVQPPAPPNPTTPDPQANYTELQKRVYNIFAQNCAKCHGDTQADGGLKLVVNGGLADLDLVDAVLIHHRTNGVNLDTKSGEVRMPKGSPPLSADTIENIRLWQVEMAKSIKVQATKQ